jgi:protein-L-isoaspartate(D-aspartate) O-methyltransferase
LVLAAMGLIERHRFVDEALASRAYEDSSLPIGHEQTISQPYIVARMTELLLVADPVNKVLEIGTGCGYQAAILSRVVREVYSIERIRALHDKARSNLRPFRFANLRLAYGDGLLGLPEAAPFDAMLIAAAGDQLPLHLLEQLRIGGRALAPLSSKEKSAQVLCLIVRTGARTWSRTELEPVRFVPLLNGQV